MTLEEVEARKAAGLPLVREAQARPTLIARCDLVIEGTRFNQLAWKRDSANSIRTEMMFEQNSNGTGSPDVIELRRLPGDWPSPISTSYDMRIYGPSGILNSRDYKPLANFGKYMFDD